MNFPTDLLTVFFVLSFLISRELEVAKRQTETKTESQRKENKKRDRERKEAEMKIQRER